MEYDDYFMFEMPLHKNTLKKNGFDIELEENASVKDALFFSYPNNGLILGVKKDAVENLIKNKEIKLIRTGYSKYDKKKLENKDDLFEYLALCVEIDQY